MSELDDYILEIAKQLDMSGEKVRVEFKEGQQAELVKLYLKEDINRAAANIIHIVFQKQDFLIQHIIDDEMLEFSVALINEINNQVMPAISTRISEVAGQLFLDNVVKH